MMSVLNNLPLNSVFGTCKSPFGDLLIVGSDEGLHAVFWENERYNELRRRIVGSFAMMNEHLVIKSTRCQLEEYLAKKRQKFDLPLSYRGTDFQIKAWTQLVAIPYGETVSYGEQATRIGHKNKARAVGAANALNPVSIIVPCHRVVGKDGSLTGFGGGIENKRYLLRHEGQVKN